MNQLTIETVEDVENCAATPTLGYVCTSEVADILHIPPESVTYQMLHRIASYMDSDEYLYETWKDVMRNAYTTYLTEKEDFINVLPAG